MHILGASFKVSLTSIAKPSIGDLILNDNRRITYVASKYASNFKNFFKNSSQKNCYSNKKEQFKTFN